MENSMKIKILTLLTGLLFLSGCGVEKMFDMPNKMDKMNEKMNQMTEKMDQTNAGMDQMIDGMGKTNSNMGEMINLMGKTVDGVDKQKILLPFQQLMDEKNYDLLTPAPTKLMPWAKEFAEAIPIKDFAELTYLWLKEIKEVNPLMELDKDGNEIPYTQAQVNQINKVKLGRLVALQAVCGFMSDEKMDVVINEHIVNYSRFESTAYKILMMRVQFIRDILLNESILSEPLSTVGEIKEAVKFAKKLDTISRLPFHDKIAVKVDGFLKPLETFEEKLDVKAASKSFKKIKLSIEKDFKLEQKNVITGNEEQDLKIQENKSKDFNEAMKTINESLRYWESQNLQ